MSDPGGAPPWVTKNQGKAAQAFARVQQAREQAPAAKQQPQQGSEQVKQSRPQPVLAPKGPVRQAVDRRAHNQQKSNDNQAARQGQKQSSSQQDRVRQMAEAVRARDAQNQKQKERGER